MKYLLLLLMFSSPVQAELILNIDLEHTSSPFIREQGYGYNALFMDLVYQDKGFYTSIGMGFHNEEIDCPEVCFGDNSLVRFKVGYKFKL